MPATAHILVVDDTPSSMRLLGGLLEAEGYRATAAPSGEEALSIIRREAPDLVLLDLLLPGLGGLDVCRLLRLDAATRALPVIVLTAAGSQERLAVLEAGADDFLNKPVDRAELLARVRCLLRMKSYQDELLDLNQQLERRVGEQVEELARLSRLRRFLPPGIADVVTSDDEEWLLATHRREVAVLFCALRGFTAFSHMAEPEQVVQVLRDFHRAAGERVAEMGATSGGISGDGMMAFFNDPLPCPEPARRAVELGAELQRIAEEQLGAWREAGHDLGLAVGIALGHATMAVITLGERVEYVPIGSAATLASRLCDRAAAGDILMSQSARASVGDLSGCDRTEPMELTGFPAPVAAWRYRPLGGRVASTPAPTGLPAPPPAGGGDTFKLDGDDWTLSFRGTAVRVRDSKGVGYLARLIARPGVEVHVAELVGVRTEGRRDAGPVIDEEAKQAYKKRLADLEADRDEARDWGDLERAVRVEEEIDFLTAELSSAFGLGGRPRRLDDPTDRMRKAVTNRIRHALGRIDELHPELGRHLTNSIRTGTFCSYRPEVPVEWHF